MQYHKQLFDHKPDQGQTGDCFRTVLACLLDMEPDQVPHFMDVPEGTPVADIWKKVNQWLSKLHLRYVAFAFATNDLEGYLTMMEQSWPGLRFELAGKSPRGVTHSVIVESGELLHDPSPEGGGIIGPDEQTGHYFMGFLVPTDIHGELK